MGSLKNLFKLPTPAAREPAKPPTTSPPTKTPKMVPCDFIDLTENEAFLICELVGGEYLGHDTRVTISELLAETVEGAIEDCSTTAFMLDYWHNHQLAPTDLPDRLRPLSSNQARCILTAAKKFWKLEGEVNLSEAQLLIEVGLVTRPT